MTSADTKFIPRPVENDFTTDKKIPPRSGGALYVGDLDESVTEVSLYETFGQVGPVASIHLCTDKQSKRSLGYAYVNFHSADDAARAINNINFTRINGREIRIMWTQPDSTIRRMNIGNVFVKNLDESIDNKTLYDTFSVFGNILSSKVAKDSFGRSLCYGFVHYADAQSAESAIKKVNKMEIASRVVEVCHFKPRSERKSGKMQFTNLYIKNFPEGKFPDKESFKKYFEQFGTVTSVYVPFDEEMKPYGYGFVNFESPELAKKLIEELNGKEPDNLYVARALSKAERRNRLHQKFLAWRENIDSLTAGRNIYVKNLPDAWDDEKLIETFKPYGEIKSALVKRDEQGNSKGFGFVLFATSENAQNSIRALHGKNLEQDNKQLFVCLWQRKHIRQQQKQEQTATSRVRSVPTPFNQNGMPPQLFYSAPVGSAGMIFASQRYRQNPIAYASSPGGRAPGMSPSSQQAQQMFQGGPPVYIAPSQQQSLQQAYNNNMLQEQMQQMQQEKFQPRSESYQGAGQMPPSIQQGQVLHHPAQQIQQVHQVPQPNQQGQVHQVPHVAHPTQQGQVPHPGQQGQVHQVRSHEQTTQQQFRRGAAVEIDDEMEKKIKQDLGEKIYKRVELMHPNTASKITGMFLEMDLTDIYSVIDDDRAFNFHIDEANGLIERQKDAVKEEFKGAQGEK